MVGNVSACMCQEAGIPCAGLQLSRYCLDVQSLSEMVRMKSKVTGSFSPTSDIGQNGVFHLSIFKCLRKLFL